MDNLNEKLGKLKLNIINWYPLKENAKVLICSNLLDKKILEQYEKKDIEFTITDDLNNNQFKFDYIIIDCKYQKEDLTKIIKKAKEIINENGTIILLCDNCIGVSSYNLKINENENLSYGKNEIENVLQKLEINNYKFYYPLPNYIFPNVIFTDNYLPNLETIMRDLTLYDENEIIAQDERKMFKKIIKNDKELFKKLTNSFIIEIGNNLSEIDFVSFNNSRNEKYRLITYKENEYFIKKINSVEAKDHFEQLINNIEIFKKLGFNIIDEVKDSKIYSKLMKQEDQLDNILIKYYLENENDIAIKIIKKFINEIKTKLPIEENNNETNIFDKYYIDISEEKNNKLHYTKYGFYDLIFQNCFYIDNKFYFYDQEWFEENIPIEFIIYRALIYLKNSDNMKKNFEINSLFEKFGISEYINEFQELEKKIQLEIKDMDIWEMHSQKSITMKNLYDTRVHYENLYNISKSELNNLNEKILNIENERDEMNKKLSIIQNSRSWKITKPLRTIRKKLNNK